jgi:bis(5'-nucleosyl)-tetraphosphatase (symmetrical)
VQPVFVGDVQGCAAELDELLARARRRFGRRFELWVVGDLVNRGPDSLRALGRVRDLVEQGRARYVLGNHEVGFLRTALGQRAPGPADTLDELLEQPDLDDWVDWIRSRPLIECGTLGDVPFVMVHAALHPDWEPSDARRSLAGARRRLAHAEREVAAALLARSPADDPDRDALARVLSCRSVAPDGGWSPAEPDGGRVAWHRAWRERGHAYGVVYGHWSLQGLHVAPGLRGLDTGCVHHGRGRDGFLTAWVPDGRPDPFGVPDGRFWQVRARRRYYRGP